MEDLTYGEKMMLAGKYRDKSEEILSLYIGQVEELIYSAMLEGLDYRFIYRSIFDCHYKANVLLEEVFCILKEIYASESIEVLFRDIFIKKIKEKEEKECENND